MPSTTCEKMSLPWSVVPNRWCQDGAWRVSRMLKAVGSLTEIHGAMIAMISMKPIRIRPNRDFGLESISESQPGMRLCVWGAATVRGTVSGSTVC